MPAPVWTDSWFSIVSSIALVAIVLSSSNSASHAQNTRLNSASLFRNFAVVSHGYGPGFTSATPRRASDYSHGFGFEEEDEDESFWSFYHLVCPTSALSASPPKLLADSRPGNAPPRTAVVPLRC